MDSPSEERSQEPSQNVPKRNVLSDLTQNLQIWLCLLQEIQANHSDGKFNPISFAMDEDSNIVAVLRGLFKLLDAVITCHAILCTECSKPCAHVPNTTLCCECKKAAEAKARRDNRERRRFRRSPSRDLDEEEVRARTRRFQEEYATRQAKKVRLAAARDQTPKEDVEMEDRL